MIVLITGAVGFFGFWKIVMAYIARALGEPY
jgi:hypothetical protein